MTTAKASLLVPRVVAEEIWRPHLVERLEGLDQLTLLVAPAGFGKTTLLAQWAGSQLRSSACWLSCDESHREPSRFWSAVVAAVSNAMPSGSEGAALLAHQEASAEVAISLANDLGEVATPLTLIIDDIHLARPMPWVLLAFLRSLPENVRVVIGSRVDLPFSLARLKGAGQITEIREDALRFSLDESAQFLALAGMQLAPEDLRRLYELVEGWPAGLRMALLSMRRDDDPLRLVRTFNGSERGLTDFLVAEVLDSLPGNVVEFMLETSVLGTLDASLCVEMLGDDQASRLLQQLLEEHLFLVPLDAYAERFRYHNLFGEFLRSRLKAQGQDRWDSTHRRAAQALIARGDVVGAMRQVAELRETEHAAITLRCVMAKALEVADRETSAAVARAWLEDHGHQLLASDPVQVVDFAAMLFLASSSDEVVWWLRRVEDEYPFPPLELDSKVSDLWAKYYLNRGRADLAVAKATAALAAADQCGHRDGLVSNAPVDLAFAHLQAGDLESTKKVLGEASQSPPAPIIVGRVRLPALSAFVAACEGELTEAEAGAERVLRMADQLNLAPSELGRTIAALAGAAVNLERDERDRAAELLEAASQGAEEMGRPSLLSLVAVEQAQCCAATGDVGGAFAWMDKARVCLVRRSESVEMYLNLRRARLAVQLHDERAADFLAELPTSSATLLLQARCALGIGDRTLADGLLEGVDQASLTRRQQVELAISSALIALNRDDDLAVGHLKEALALARPERLVRTIIDLGPGLNDLFALLPVGRGRDDYLQRLALEAQASIVASAGPPLTLMRDPLTEREQVVLRYLSSRLTYKEIASFLYVSLNTLKSHVRAVYRKLDVETRPEAIEVARALHLL